MAIARAIVHDHAFLHEVFLLLLMAMTIDFVVAGLLSLAMTIDIVVVALEGAGLRMGPSV